MAYFESWNYLRCDVTFEMMYRTGYTMAEDSILWLNQITLAQHALVGGKAATLGLLHRVGFPVPDGFCLPIDVTPHNIDVYW